MYSLRKLQAYVLGRPADTEEVCSQLRASSVPVSSADCRSCSDPCDLGHDAYPSRFEVDWETQMLGSVPPYNRQIVISTGKADWERVITDAKGSLATHLSQLKTSLPEEQKLTQHATVKSPRQAAGLFRTSDSTRVSVLNGSHRSICEDDDNETVLVFPDFKVVTEVERTIQGAQELWDSSLDPSVGRTGAFPEKSQLKTWVLPYSCVILLCSHKKRDNRCGIAAPKLEHAFIRSLEHHGWDADTRLECPSYTYGSPLEDLAVTVEQREEIIQTQLKESAISKRALIVKVSHIGGHKYAGNCIIYTPQGAGVWYGRVTPHDVESIVENTIIDGLVLPPLLRGGLNLSRPGCKSLNDW
ncbi:Altered inheritance of mitochondria protein 32 [Leucoagaricus sp. SymC.cos]|nr:Altered inheritance of mitochondria protein 32 [Leucoagaricus sp. SymC.cos]